MQSFTFGLWTETFTTQIEVLETWLWRAERNVNHAPGQLSSLKPNHIFNTVKADSTWTYKPFCMLVKDIHIQEIGT